MKKSIVLLLSMAALVCTGICPGAQANTSRIYSASSCQPDAGGHLELKLYQGLTHQGTSTRYAWCPITAVQSSAVNFDEIVVSVYDGHPTSNVQCTVFSRTLGGTTYASSTEENEVTASLLEFITFTGSELPNAGNTMYSVIANSIYCRLNPNDAINGFSIDTLYN